MNLHKDSAKMPQIENAMLEAPPSQLQGKGFRTGLRLGDQQECMHGHV